VGSADVDRPPTDSLRSTIKLGHIQAMSGAVFALFLVLHLVTTMSGALGTATYDRTLVALRSVYRSHLFLELVVIGLSGITHLVCAILQMTRRRKVFALRGPWWMKLHRLSGYFLMTVIIGHVFATRIAPTLATGPTTTHAADFAFLAFATLTAPAFFWPYYLLLGIAGALHLSIGLHLGVRMLGLRTQGSGGAPSRLRLLLSFGVTILVTAGVLGILLRADQAPRQRFPEYQALMQRLLS
jgi:succinate dehydrogenase/fumarate reductase cytochrome b subunit